LLPPALDVRGDSLVLNVLQPGGVPRPDDFVQCGVPRPDDFVQCGAARPDYFVQCGVPRPNDFVALVLCHDAFVPFLNITSFKIQELLFIINDYFPKSSNHRPRQ
jgi:hypothetical protein